MGGVRWNWMLAGLDGGYLLKQTMARSLIPKGFGQESLLLHVRQAQ
jgi:hypothetical protein